MPSGSQGSNNKRVGVAITREDTPNPRNAPSPHSTRFPPAFPSVGDTDAYSLLAFPNQTNPQKAFELRDDKRCQLGERAPSTSLSRSRSDRAKYVGAKANAG